jgi:hypothetical protein
MSAACGTFSGVESGEVVADGGVGDALSPDAANASDAPASASKYVRAVLDDNPLAYYRLGEATGTVVRSIVGGDSIAGTILGAPKLGVAGALHGDPDTALAFTAGGQFVSAGGNFDFVGRAPFTLEAWVNLTGVDDEYRHLFTKDLETGGAREQYGMYVRAAPPYGGSLVLERWVANTKRFAVYTGSIGGSASPIALNAWHHVVGTYDGTNLVLYVDTAKVASMEDTTQQASKDVPFVFGGKNASEGTLLGSMDEVAVYASALSAARVKAHFEAR